MKVLRDNGYEGWLVVEAEQDPVVAPSYAYADKGFPHAAGLIQ
jgi:sugar phosphate isomerase/epimerase